MSSVAYKGCAETITLKYLLLLYKGCGIYDIGKKQTRYCTNEAEKTR